MNESKNKGQGQSSIGTIADDLPTGSEIESEQTGRPSALSDERKELLETRRFRVQELKEQGFSTREIAEKEGISHVTVINDLKVSDSSGKALPDESDVEEGRSRSFDGSERFAKV